MDDDATGFHNCGHFIRAAAFNWKGLTKLLNHSSQRAYTTAVLFGAYTEKERGLLSYLPSCKGKTRGKSCYCCPDKPKKETRLK